MSANGFISELQKLLDKTPRMPLVIVACENCYFSNEIYSCKNVNYSFDTYHTTNSLYLADSFMCDNCVDCDYAVESQLCYECVDPFKAYNCHYIEYSAYIRDSAYSYNCGNCNNIFGCVNLHNKQFCIFNRQLTEAEYKEKVKDYWKWPPEKILKYVEDLKERFPFSETNSVGNENTSYGNYIHYNKNCYLCFDAAYDENCAYLYDSFHNSNCLDMTYTAVNTQQSYQVSDSTTLFNCSYAIHCADCMDSNYIFRCMNVKNCLGCVKLENKQYCILNRQFSKGEYEKQSAKIMKALNEKNLAWGDLTF